MKAVFKKFTTKKNLFILGVIVLVVLVVLVFTNNIFSSGANTSSSNEAKILAKKVGKLMYLPLDETPTIATVSDPELLKNQVFFVDAKKGDKVLIYPVAKKAILYDPEEGKIITIAPLSVNGNGVGVSTNDF